MSHTEPSCPPSALSTPDLAAILASPERAPLTIGRETATELGIAALEHLEGEPAGEDVRSLVTYAARHDEASPARDALVAVLLNASGTLPAWLAAAAREEFRHADWGTGREAAALAADPEVTAVPRRQALSERLMNERARRIRPRMHAFAASVLAHGAAAGNVPSWFLERSWIDLRDTLVQRGKNEPMHREAIAEWVAAQHPAVRKWLRPVEESLIDVATQAILHAPQRAPLAPYCGEDRVAEAVRTAVNYRGEYARERLAGYLARLAPGTDWYETIRGIVDPQSTRQAR